MAKIKTPQKPINTISDRLYFDSFAVHKTIISANFKHPILKKEVCHKFHIGTLQKWDDPKKFEAEMQKTNRHDFLPKVDKSDLTKELQLFVPEPREHMIYFYFEIHDGTKRLPLHYAPFYNRDCFHEDDPVITGDYERTPDWRRYLEQCERELSLHVYEGKIHPSYFFDLFNFFHEFGFALFECLNTDSPEYIDEPMDAWWFEDYKRQFKRIKEPAMRNYALAVLDSVFQKANQDQEVMQCQFCGRYIEYTKNKKFCSLQSEKRDCAKKARNKRYYTQKGRQRPDSYRKATKELRAFYKEKNIKK